MAGIRKEANRQDRKEKREREREEKKKHVLQSSFLLDLELQRERRWVTLHFSLTKHHKKNWSPQPNLEFIPMADLRYLSDTDEEESAAVEELISQQ